MTDTGSTKDEADSLLEKASDVLDDVKEKGQAALAGQSDKIEGVIESAAKFADDKTGGKHSEKIEAVVEKAKDVLDSLTGDEESEGPEPQTKTEPAGDPQPPPPGVSIRSTSPARTRRVH